MGTSSVGKRSYRYVGKRAWKVAQYLLLLPLYSIGISLRPVIAGSVPARTVVNSSSKSPVPLTYTLVQKTSPGTSTGNFTDPNGTIELNAEQQEFNNKTQVVNATGKVVLRFNKALLQSDRLRVNLKTKIAVAEGNVSLIRGKQILYGNQFEYNFEDDKGSIVEARGDIYQPTLVSDLNVIPKATTVIPAGEKRFPDPVLSDRLRNDQPFTSIQSTSSTGVVVGNERDIEYQPTLKPTGKINRLRFQADKIDFTGDRVTAQKVRITNDPFSPPELQIKSDRIQFKTVDSNTDEITLNSPRITIENNFDIPIPKDRFVLSKLGTDPNPFNFSFDGGDRGGLYVEGNFYPVLDPRFRVTITPQYFIQKAVTELNFFDGSVFGLRTNIDGTLSQDTTVQASASLAGLNLNKFGSNLRAKASVKQNLSLFGYPHLFTGEAVYREQVFNGSLGYQDVQSSIGGVLTSPSMPIGNTGINLNYQFGAQVVNATTDRQNLIAANKSSDLVSLNRYQTAANITKSFRLWEGKGLPPESKETYNYSPVPVVPYLQLNTGIRGAFSSYSNGDSQSSMGYDVGIQGQIGNFSKSSFDYTGFNLNYFQQFRGEQSSPFLFDRIVDNRILSAGISQQISGPFRAGIQSSLNLDSGKQISTDYYLEYNRRTYNFIIRYNPALQLGSIGFRLNDFNWDGVTPKF
jgi:Protein of unknown function (DUF3769)